MPIKQATRSKLTLSDPDQVGKSLAQVVLIEGGRDVVLGQAWIGAPDMLVTCGHVVEPYAKTPNVLIVRFPASGKQYQIASIRLHPSFVRQPDGMVKFDVAVLQCKLGYPESEAHPLPFSFELEFRNNQSLSTIRFPAHLGQFSAAVQPLTQSGRFLGFLRKHDSFHLLHDVPLAPGDSGAPLISNKMVVGIHCGDTATLPGLNLATTSIRLGLWVDALRELGFTETRHAIAGRRVKPYYAAGVAFVMTAVLAFMVAYMQNSKDLQQVETEWNIGEQQMSPLQVKYNRPPHQYIEGQKVEIFLDTTSECYAYAFLASPEGQVLQLFPAPGESGEITAAKGAVIDQFAKEQILAEKNKNKMYFVALNTKSANAARLGARLISDADRSPQNKALLKIKTKDLEERLRKLSREHPNDILYNVLDAPTTE